MIRSLAAENNIKSTPMAQLTQARAWQIITAIDKHLIIDLRAEFATKEEAKNAIPAMQGIGNSLIGLVPFFKSHMIPFFEQQTSQYKEANAAAPEMSRALDAADRGLRAMHTGTVQNAAVARIEIDSDKPVATAVMLLTLMPRAAKTQ